MPKSIRIRTEVGQNTSKQLNVKLEQDFDFLEILSLKLLQSDIYIKQCSDYGVVIGRVLVNNGYGIPNAKISVFIPLDNEDETNPIINALYPYKSIDQVNEDGYRYNLLPYEPSYPGHNPTGTFPSRKDVLLDKTAVALYDKYYKFTVQTNQSGDFMIFGVPVGTQTLVMDVDLSDIGEFSLSPQDLIRIGLATPTQVDGTVFKTSENLNTLPQIINVTRTIEILPFWGEPDTCQVAITRTDFDLGLEANLEIQPAAIFMGSLVSTPEEQAQKTKCRVNKNAGNQCSLVSGPGQIKAIRQTIFEDDQGRPALETFNFENDGNIIDENGTWLVDVPMNMDYISTDEFGQRIISNDPKVGVPSSAKYRFKVKWQQQPNLSEPVKRGYFLVPNIREYGWENYDEDPSKYELPPPFNNPNPTAEIFNGAPFDNQILIPAGQIQSKSVIKVIGQTNIKNYSFLVGNNPYPITQKDNIIVNPGEEVIVQVELENPGQGQMFFNFEPYEKYQVERSYSFSLSWDDYADEQTAINCQDTFYEMRYNKVYTVSQLVDQYRRGFANTKFLSIKDITDESCQSTSNPFPTNDAQYKTTFLYLLFSFMILIFRPTLYSLLFVSHAIAFILKYLILPIVVIIAVIFLIVILICNIVNGISQFFGGGGVNCPDFGDLRDLVQDLLSLWKKMIIRLPNLTYPDCEICNCIDEDAQSYDDDPYAEQSAQLTKDAPSGILYDFTNIFQYKNLQNDTGDAICCISDTDDCGTLNFEDDAEDCNARLLAVQVGLGGSGSPPYSYGGPNVTDTETPNFPRKGFVSTTLPIAERVNLFNAKSKFFIGDGINRIRVTFNPNTNLITNANQCHEDNVVIVLVDRNTISQYERGQLISFQDSGLSKDVNAANLVTGQTIDGIHQITVKYANSSNANALNSQRIYNINFTGGTTTQVKFPMDIEYYQVIYTSLLSELKTDSMGDSFFSRIFNQPIYMNKIKEGTFEWSIDEFREFSPSMGGLNGRYGYEFIEDWENIGVLILNRGVDPHSPKVEIEYGIGRLFGLQAHQKTVRGDFRLNIPIQSSDVLTQGGYRCVRHTVPNNNSQDSLSKYLYFPTYNQLNIDSTKFTSFTNNLHTYYISLDSNTFGALPVTLPGYPTTFPDADPYKCGRGVRDLGANGIAILNYNIETDDSGTVNGWVETPNVIGCAFTQQNQSYPTSAYNNSGYKLNEKVEGCSFAHLSFWGIEQPRNQRAYGAQGIYHSRKYADSISIQIQHSPQFRYVMRSDRLPTSTYNFINGDNHMALQQNTGFAFFKVSEDGTFASSGSFVGGGGYNGDSTGDNVPDTDNPTFVNEVLESFTCGEENSTLVPFDCYKYDPVADTIYIDDPDCFYKNPFNVEFFKNNCYQLVTKPLLSIPVDVIALLEWISRAKVFFGLCQGVFRHMFTNSWINGTLFPFSFKNDRFFDTRYNRPYNKTCEDTVYFHRPTNNFFYRSSPYNGSGFIGRKASKPLLQDYFGGNVKNLMFPTTLMDLGPRDEISKFLSQSASEEYEGYIVNKIPTTTFNEIDDILNLFVISRLANTNFLEQFFGVGGASILNYFTRERNVNATFPSPFDYNIKNKNMVDSDYAQLISINSEFGIVPFDVEAYPQQANPTQQQTIFFNGNATASAAVIGIFFSSFTQNRDFISPKRIVYNPQAGLAANDCNLNPIPVRDQLVPLYQWAVQQDTNPQNDSIFGTQKSFWYSAGIGGQQGGTEYFHNSKYQSMDRLISQSRFFRTNNTNQNDFYKGYIYSVDTPNNEITEIVTYTDQSTYLNNRNVITAGGPFFFYFGLNRGASAMDRFIQKWVDTENNIE